MKKTISSLLTAAIAITSFASGKQNDDNPSTKTQTYVLVHGAWQAPYVWDAVKTELTNSGKKVIVVELPGHGADNTATYIPDCAPWKIPDFRMSSNSRWTFNGFLSFNLAPKFFTR